MSKNSPTLRAVTEKEKKKLILLNMCSILVNTIGLVLIATI